MEKLLQFALSDIELFENDDDQDFAFAKLEFLSDKNNSHRNPISLEVLKRDAHTALGKFVIGRYNKFMQDTMSHEDEQFIYGYVPPNGKIDFKEKDGKTFAVCDAVISKLYATPIVQMFQKDNHRSVSCEFTANLQFAEEDINPGEDNPILGFNIRGITILGQKVKPSCAGADMEIIKFSEEKAKNYYNNHSVNSLKKFTEERRKSMAEKTIKVNKTELKDTPWGDVSKTELRNKVMSAKNKASLVHDIYALVEYGWEDAPSEHLKYPIMEISGDTAYYNKGGLSSALGYAKAEGQNDVVSKVEKIRNKFGIEDEEGDEKKMAKKEFAVDIGDIWGKLYSQIEIKYPDRDWGSIYRIHGIYEEGNKKFAIIYKKDEVKMYRLDFDLTEDGLFLDDTITGVEQEFVESEEIKKFSDEKVEEKYKKFADPKNDSHATNEEDKKEVDEDKKDDEEEKDEDDEDADVDDDEEDDKKKVEASKKKMSLDSHVDAAAFLQMLENETDDYKKLADEVLKEMEDDKYLVMKKYIEMAKECDGLRKFKAEKEQEAKEFEVNKTLMEAKDDLSEKEFEDLKSEGMACKYEEMDAFANKVRAFAYKNAKEKKVEKTETKEFAKMAFAWDNYMEKSANTMSADEIYNKYL